MTLHKVTFNQQFNGIIYCSPADPVLVVLHFDIQGLYIKMVISKIYFTQNCIALGRPAMAVVLKISGKNVFYRFQQLFIALFLIHF